MVNQSDIAKISGVNISTVSRVLNNAQGVGDETRNKILQIAAELGYKTRFKRTMNDAIGVIIPELFSQYYAALTHTLEKRIKDKGFSMIITISDFDADKIIHDFETMCHHDVRGIICSLPIVYDNETKNMIIESTKSCNVPIVFLSDVENDEHVIADHICLDEKSGMEQIIKHLLDLGHDRIGYVGESLSTRRLSIFRQLMTERGLDIDPQYIKEGNTRFEKGGYEQMKLLLAGDSLPTAVIVSYDQFAIGALKAIEEAGLYVPDDLSVVSFDNIVTGEFLSVKLTSITNPVVSMGQIATRLLFNKIFNPDEAVIQKVLLQPTLVVRESTGILNKRVRSKQA